MVRQHRAAGIVPEQAIQRFHLDASRMPCGVELPVTPAAVAEPDVAHVTLAARRGSQARIERDGYRRRAPGEGTAYEISTTIEPLADVEVPCEHQAIIQRNCR